MIFDFSKFSLIWPIQYFPTTNTFKSLAVICQGSFFFFYESLIRPIAAPCKFDESMTSAKKNYFLKLKNPFWSIVELETRWYVLVKIIGPHVIYQGHFIWNFRELVKNLKIYLRQIWELYNFGWCYGWLITSLVHRFLGHLPSLTSCQSPRVHLKRRTRAAICIRAIGKHWIDPVCSLTHLSEHFNTSIDATIVRALIYMPIGIYNGIAYSFRFSLSLSLLLLPFCSLMRTIISPNKSILLVLSTLLSINTQ